MTLPIQTVQAVEYPSSNIEAAWIQHHFRGRVLMQTQVDSDSYCHSHQIPTSEPSWICQRILSQEQNGLNARDRPRAEHIFSIYQRLRHQCQSSLVAFIIILIGDRGRSNGEYHADGPVVKGFGEATTRLIDRVYRGPKTCFHEKG